MGAELARSRAGKKTKTGMSDGQLSDFASKMFNSYVLAKSASTPVINMIDDYLFKHGHMLPCGHHAEEGGEMGKACSISGCGSPNTAGIPSNSNLNVGTTTRLDSSGNTYTAPAGTGNSWGSSPGGGSMGIHATDPNSTQFNYRGTGATSGAYWSGRLDG